MEAEKQKTIKLVSKIIVKFFGVLMFFGGTIWLFFLNWKIAICVTLIIWGWSAANGDGLAE